MITGCTGATVRMNFPKLCLAISAFSFSGKLVFFIALRIAVGVVLVAADAWGGRTRAGKEVEVWSEGARTLYG